MADSSRPRNPSPLSASDEELLAMILGGERSVDEDSVRERLDAKPELRERLEQLREVRSLLEQDSELEAQALREVEEEDQSEGSKASMSSDASAPKPPMQLRWKIGLALAVAAILVVATVLMNPSDPGEPPWRPGTGDPLGNEEILEPRPGPEVEAWGEFAVRLRSVKKIKSAIVEISPAAGGPPVSLPFAEGPDSEGNLRWMPTAQQLERLPRKITWEVVVTDLNGVSYNSKCFQSELR